MTRRRPITELEAIAALEALGYSLFGMKSERDQHETVFNFSRPRAKVRPVVVVRLCIPAKSPYGKAWAKLYAKNARKKSVRK